MTCIGDIKNKWNKRRKNLIKNVFKNVLINNIILNCHLS